MDTLYISKKNSRNITARPLSLYLRFCGKKSKKCVSKEKKENGDIMNKTIRKRMFLEKKYSNYCLFFKIPLPEVGNRVVSISPSAYYYHTGIREQSGDSKIFKELSLNCFSTRSEHSNNPNPF